MAVTDIGDPGADLGFCWSCDAPVSPRALFCSACGAIQPPGEADHFARLGMLRSYDVDPAHLDHQHEGFRRRLDPDRFAKRSPKERRLAQDHVARLSEAYEILKDPFHRAVYLLHLAGQAVDVAKAEAMDGKGQPSPIRELRRALAQAHSAEALAALVARVEVEAAHCQDALAEAFAADDLDQAALLAARLGCFAKLAEDARARGAQLARREL